jgi:hypothetical protein
MAWNVEYTDEFGLWWGDLTEGEQEDVAVVVQLLEERGPSLPFPHSSDVNDSRHGHMRELRIQSGGKPLRVLVPIADDLYDEHLRELSEEQDNGR